VAYKRAAALNSEAGTPVMLSAFSGEFFSCLMSCAHRLHRRAFLSQKKLRSHSIVAAKQLEWGWLRLSFLQQRWQQ
jgi:hypothetical protein